MTEKKKRKVGRPTKYKEEYCDTIIEYFTRERTKEVPVTKVSKGEAIETVEIRPVSPATLYGFAASIGVCHDTIHEWTTQHPKFSDAVKKAKALQADHIVNNAMEGVAPNAFAIFMMKNNFNWTDKRETKLDARVSLEDLVDDSFDEE